MDWLGAGVALVIAVSFFALVGLVAYLNGEGSEDEGWGEG